MPEPLMLPVLPLRDTVIFPGVAAPIQAGRATTLGAVRKAHESDDKRVFVVAQRDNTEKIAPDRLYTIGTIARIEQLQRGRGVAQLVLRGESRGIAVRIDSRDDHYAAIVRVAEEMAPVDPENPAFVGLERELRLRATELGEKAGLASELVAHALAEAAGPGVLADLVASHLELDLEERQALLETLSVEERLRRVLVHVQRQIQVVEAQEEIKSQVQQELGDRQREMVLREQLKAIQRELGEGEEGGEADDLRQKLEALELPAEARKEVERELNRLGRTNRDSMEHQVIRTYLENIAELPWNERSEDHLDLTQATAVLEEDHYGLKDVKDRVLEFLAVRQLRAAAEQASAADEPAASEEASNAEATPEPVAGNEDDRSAKGPILLFVGPPGVGKTSIAKSIARAMGREYVRISLGGARDEADIRGHRRTYVGAMPGRIIHGMKQAGTRNPVFLLDEVDKLGVSYQGDPASGLLEVLDPAQNDSFVDHYLGVPFDLSEVLFIATANFIEAIPGPLRDRMEVVEFTGYTEGEKLEIAKRYLVPRQTRRNALDRERLEISDEALSAVVTHYTREAGVRQLEREIGQLARKVARRIASGEVERARVGREDVGELLGRPRIHPEKAARTEQVGVATGMFYTPVGGDILFVEVSTMKGKGDLVLTGQLGDVMKESARAAWSFARSRAMELGIRELDFERDVHIHVPAGAIPKDGPSAGITMATALVSALAGRPVRHDLAMTGELTLTGRVLPIGGVKEKVLGAVRAGIWEIVLPRENEQDLEDLPREVRERIRAYPVDSLSEVLEIALLGEPSSAGEGPLTEGLLTGEGERPTTAH
jgi:ATP-dependent Lon protease